VPPFAVEVPPTRALGDLAVAVAFQLARTLRKPPRAIAQELAQAVGSIPGVERIVATPNGYLNLYLDRAAFLIPRIRQQVAPDAATLEKTVVEHTAINPNKAAHIGHLRNAALGDTLVRALRFRGTPVEIAELHRRHRRPGRRHHRRLPRARAAEPRRGDGDRRLDAVRLLLLGPLLAVTEWYDGDRARLGVRAAALHDLEHGGNDAPPMGAFIVDRIVRAHLQTMARLNIGYDLLTYEGDILRLHSGRTRSRSLKAQGAVFLQTEGKLAGCWVMRIEKTGSDARRADSRGAERPEESREKVIVRSNGVVTYIGKDLANQFWKLGLLGLDFHYRRFATQATAAAVVDDVRRRRSGRAGVRPRERIYNVIDSRQMYLQALLSQALRTLGHAKEAENSIHFSYEMVALSHATARELGYETPADGDEREEAVRRGLGRKGSASRSTTCSIC
jgi:arginyl-tRNA synthetase